MMTSLALTKVAKEILPAWAILMLFTPARLSKVGAGAELFAARTVKSPVMVKILSTTA